ncbi:hypothetical protein JL101_007520 [Skermanella rosea]|uniref:hypothetical protein n=1 Tax=Skermanella rosea TaxID=1817965 RepID=UPI001932A0E3|nr:hypothetical protein [Skermanella rosea]UEM05276.1 hypothetical protein JL101_007520 [Skermanella rosea]
MIGRGAREPVFSRARADHVAGTEFQGTPTGVRWRLFGDTRPPLTATFFLPEDADGEGVLDHVLITASAGFGRDAVDSLATHDRLFDGRNGERAVRCDRLGLSFRAGSVPSLFGRVDRGRPGAGSVLTPPIVLSGPVPLRCREVQACLTASRIES